MCNVLASVILTLTSLVSVAEQPKFIAFPRSGYMIEALDPGPSQEGNFDSLKMLLPPKDEFASNVNVQHQVFPGTLKEYATISEAGIKKASWKISNVRIENDSYIAEAIGSIPGIQMEFHFYFKAIKSGKNVILATATIPTSRWETEKTLLVPIVDSLAPLRQSR